MPLESRHTPNTRSSPRRATHGFTLIEILVVVFIIGIISGIAVLSDNGRAGQERLRQEAQRLQALLRIAAEDSVLYSIEIGLDLTTDGYRFLTLEENLWRPMGDAGPLRPRKLPEPMELHLLQDGAENASLIERAKTERENSKEKKQDGVRPEILFLSSGELTPFELELSATNTGAHYYFSGVLTGKVSMRTDQQDDSG